MPLAAPSANPIGYVSPPTPHHVNSQLGKKIDYILDGGSCTIGLESTIVGIDNNGLCIYRLGGLTIEEIENEVGKVELNINNSSNPIAPGQLKSHYSPKKPLFVGEINTLLKTQSSKKIAIICFGEENYSRTDYIVFNLSENKNMSEAAINLFNYLRLADECESEIVVCGKLPEVDLGRAINDRLRRASC